MPPREPPKLALLKAPTTPSDTVRTGPDGRLEVVGGALAERFTVRETERAVEVMAHLDSADRRLQRLGLDVVSISGGGRLVAFDQNGVLAAEQIGPDAWPALTAALADGPVRQLIADPLGVRALLPFARSRADVALFGVLNADGKTVARVRWRDVQLVAPVRRRLPGSVAVEGLRGYAAEARQVHHLLQQSASMSVADGTWLDLVRQAPGVGLDGRPRLGMHPDQAADLAVADALLGYLSVIEGTVKGIVADVDTEFLHDFRVAVRRTRSVLKLLGGVFPSGMAERAGAEFRWLGDVTTPTRDLDVYLLGIESMASSLTGPRSSAHSAGT